MKMLFFAIRIPQIISWLSVIFFTITISHAQNELSFGEVQNINLQGSTPGINTGSVIDSVTITIPPNKVWKIEGARCATLQWGAPLAGSSARSCNVSINQVPLYQSPDGGVDYYFEFPLWFEAGTYTIKLYGRNSAGSSSLYSGFVSAIEFSVIP